jgi:hypothetical protein
MLRKKCSFGMGGPELPYLNLLKRKFTKIKGNRKSIALKECSFPQL